MMPPTEFHIPVNRGKERKERRQERCEDMGSVG